MIRITFFTHYTELYGANRSLLALLQYIKLYCKNIQPIVFLPTMGPLQQELQKIEIPFIEVYFPYTQVSRSLNYKGRTIELFRSAWSMFKLLRYHQIIRKTDIIYSNSSVISQGWLLAKIFRKKHFWHIREYALSHYNLTPLFGIKTQSFMYRTSDRVIFVSGFLRDALFPDKICENHHHVIHNGVYFREQNIITSQRKFSVSAPIQLCFIGLMHQGKNFDQAVAIIDELRAEGLKVHLHVCADMSSPYGAKMLQLIKEKQLEGNITFHGYVDDVREILESSHFLLMCSTSEAMGRVTAEAMFMGTPVIGKKSGGTAELYEHGISGIHYTSIDAVVNFLNALTPEEYQLMSEQAETLAKNRYSIETYGNSIVKLMEAEVGR